MKEILHAAKRHLVQAASVSVPDRIWITIHSRRSRNHQLRHLAKEGFLEIGREFVARHGTTVLHGPFEGMKYPFRAVSTRHAIPRLLGSYELELHPVLESLKRCYRCAIDIGSAEGYYAVGLAMRLRIPVFAFETDARERALSREMASLNRVDDLVLPSSYCDRLHLAALGAGRSLILSDCEGYELELFNEEMAAKLRFSDLLIETHGPETVGVLAGRFATTHQVSIFASQARSSRDFPEVDFLGERAALAVSEERPTQSWIWCESGVGG